MSNRGHGGRPSKGPRAQKTLRSPEPVVEAGVARALDLGLDFNDYVTMLMAKDTGLDEFAPTPRPRADQGVLPIGRGDVRLAQSA
ncbi:hypothetical protein [Cellulomonas sp. Y8]|jgi:hypothetical protein|uniref:hypothetical protein n=1 Tax=Cellulomonas sp. Y8 TaxID=2591145 RepID=UPI003D719D93